MNVLFLGPRTSPVVSFLREHGENVRIQTGPLKREMLRRVRPAIVISHGYRHIISSEVVELVRGRAVNLHISYLPWNRGADPNLWSWIEETPKGVTIHYIDEGIDTGDIIAQRYVEFGESETLASSYARLQEAIFELFQEQWPLIKGGLCARTPQFGAGTFHQMADRDRVQHLLPGGWDTPVSVLSKS